MLAERTLAFKYLKSIDRNHNKNDEKVLNRQILSDSLKRKAFEDIYCNPSKLQN